MTSRAPSELPALERDLPTTEGDVEALRRIAERRREEAARRLDYAALVPPAGLPRRPRRLASDDWEPFTL